MSSFKARLFGLVVAGTLLASCNDQIGQTEGESLGSTDEFATADGLIADRDSLPGAKLYAENCASCHDGGVAKAPHFQWLEMMSPASNTHSCTG